MQYVRVQCVVMQCVGGQCVGMRYLDGQCGEGLVL